jgi:hypothetical protein
MLEELRWKTSVSASCLHAAACHAAGLSAADAHLEELTDPAADTLIGELIAAAWPVTAVLNELASLTSEIDNNRELVTRTVARMRLPAKDVASPVRVAGAIADFEAAMQRAEPQLAEELAARVRPIREQWEARGPGMLIEIARLTDAGIIPTAAEIVLVAPYVGGHGVAHPAYNRVILEAVLANPLPELPETVRIAWLLAQLNAELPLITDAVPPARSLEAMQVALIAPVLAAAEAVELSTCNESSIASAVQAWLPSLNAANAASQIWSWWNAWLDYPTRWPVAVAALEQMTTSRV